MSLSLNELLKKAQNKGIKSLIPNSENYLRPWQGESTLYVKQKNKIEHKPNTNRTQIEHNKKHKSITNETQIEHKQNTNLTQIEHNKKHKSITNETQIEHKQNTINEISLLVGLQRLILKFLFNDCKINRSKSTQEISLISLADNLNIKIGSIKTTLRRLEQKKLITNITHKKGRAGWRKYNLSDKVYNELININFGIKWDTNRVQIEHESDTKMNTASSSSSCIDNLNTTTTNQIKKHENTLLPDWDDINYDGFRKHNIFFGKNQVLLLWEFLKNYSAFDFQESIDSFVYDIEHKHVHIRKGALSMFIGIIRSGQLYISSHYVSPERQKMNEIISLSKKREEDKILYLAACEEENLLQFIKEYGEDNIKKQISDVSLLIDFEHKGKYAMEWIKNNLYKKILVK